MPAGTGAGGGGGGAASSSLHDALVDHVLVLLHRVSDALAKKTTPNDYPGNPLVINTKNVYVPTDPDPLRHVIVQMAMVLHLLERRSNGVAQGMSGAWTGPVKATSALGRLAEFSQQLLAELQLKPRGQGQGPFTGINWGANGTNDLDLYRQIISAVYNMVGELYLKPPTPTSPPVQTPTDPFAGNSTANPTIYQADHALLMIGNYLSIIADELANRTLP